MNRLTPPHFSVRETYLSCLSDVQDNQFVYKNRMEAILLQIVSAGALYEQRAIVAELHLFSFARHGHGEDIILNGINKDNLVTLYGGYFSKSGTSSRDIYDYIRASSVGVCPFCGFGNVTTLDHYLPKARYPLFSVIPANLVPSCADCNKGKGSSVLNAIEDQPLHPYFSEDKFYNESWIKARIEHTLPPSMVYFASPPLNWDEPSKQRAINHFRDFDLANRFAIQAGLNVTSAIATVESLLPIIGIDGVKTHFNNIATKEPPNSVIGSMHRALTEDDWFCTGGAIV
jgi:hypothetical protein